jgi:hypothetical protein
VFDAVGLSASGATIADGAGLPGGVPAERLVSGGQLTVRPTVAEGYPAAYVTTEVWVDFPEVWLQPLYAPITGFAPDGSPMKVPNPNTSAWQPIFSVGPHSGFYSPFWQIIYFQVPSGTAYDAVTSVRGVIDGGYPLFPGKGLVAPLVPDGVALDSPATVGDAALAVDGFRFGTGWLDGGTVSYVQFPVAPFTWNEDQVVNEVPLYYFLFPDDNGHLAPIPDIPTVMGTGPPYSHTPAPVDVMGAATPKYSAYWRLYVVIAPPSAKVFAPPGSPLDGKLPASAKAAPDVYSSVTQFNGTGDVVLDPSCLNKDADPVDKAPCPFLDSQDRIEQYVDPANIQRTSITVTCPLVSINGAPVMIPGATP